MNDRMKHGFGILGLALLLGLLGDLLLRATPWGVNIFFWAIALLLSVILLIHRWRVELAGDVLRFALPVVFFAFGFVWRDSLTLKALDALALLVILSLFTMRSQAIQLRLSGLVRYLEGFVLTGINLAAGIFPLVLADIAWKDIPRGGWSRQSVAVLRGLLIALPLLLVFGSLLMAADAVFAGIIKNLLHFNLADVFKHIFVTGLAAWPVGGFLRGIFLADKQTMFSGELPKSPGLGIVEMGVALGSLNVLFLGFVFVQFRYFFGGAEVVTLTSGLTYAEYARRGFFELVVAAALVLPLLLFGHWLLRKDQPTYEKVFRLLAGMLIVMLFVVLASAFQRMHLYQQEYGLTELRLYTTAFMGWLAVVFIWFGATVLRGKGERFAFGAVVAGFLTIVVLSSFNPEALIIRTNAALAKTGKSFDVDYALSLSADAVPSLVAALPDLDPKDRCNVATLLLKNWSPSTHTDWRTWNWGQARARRVVEKNQDDLQEMVKSWFIQNF